MAHSDRVFSQVLPLQLRFIHRYVFVLKSQKWEHNLFLNLIVNIHRITQFTRTIIAIGREKIRCEYSIRP